MTTEERLRIQSYEQDCGLVRVQAVNQGGADDALRTLDRVDAALGVASRHLERIHSGELKLTPAVTRDIEASIDRARKILGVGRG